MDVALTGVSTYQIQSVMEHPVSKKVDLTYLSVKKFNRLLEDEKLLQELCVLGQSLPEQLGAIKKLLGVYPDKKVIAISLFSNLNQFKAELRTSIMNSKNVSVISDHQKLEDFLEAMLTKMEKERAYKELLNKTNKQIGGTWA